MRIRFLQTTPSMAGGFPFQPGQIIRLSQVTEDVRRWLDAGLAEAMPDAEDEAAVLGVPPESAVLTRPRPRGRR